VSRGSAGNRGHARAGPCAAEVGPLRQSEVSASAALSAEPREDTVVGIQMANIPPPALCRWEIQLQEVLPQNCAG
jgi:hypothetical protein